MSNAMAIAATTATLRSLLSAGIPRLDASLNDLEVTAQPLDKARSGVSKAQLNLFLYQTVFNAAWRNSEHPRQVRPGETGFPALALNLHYVLTAYGRGESDNDAVSHRVLGGAMSVLHDHPLLGADEIRTALAGNDLFAQLERVRITPQPMTIEEMSKLWTSFQTNYRLSSAYEVSVVLIDSARATATPLPVLTRGKDDSGVVAQADLESPYPNLKEITIPRQQPSVRLGDELKLLGGHLDGTNLGVLFKHLRWVEARRLAPSAGANAGEVTVVIPDQPADWPAGFYTVTVTVQRPTESYDRVTNELSFGLAPRISSITPDPAARDGNDAVTLTVTVRPEVLPEQRATLLLGSREILADPHPAQTDQLVFQVPDVAPGKPRVRVRIDGVDSLLVDRSTTPPRFDPSQQVEIT
jgi:hypothetical protein